MSEAEDVLLAICIGAVVVSAVLLYLTRNKL